MFRKTIPDVRFGVNAAALLALAASLAGAARAADESHEAKLRHAVQDQARKNQAEEDELKRRAAVRDAKFETMQKQEEAEQRQSDQERKQKMELRRQEQAARERELEARIEGHAEQVAKAMAASKAGMKADDVAFQSGADVRAKEFSQKLKANLDDGVAEAKSRRERNKQIAIELAMTYFTGGAAFPALAATNAGDGGGTAAQVAPAVTRKTPAASPARSPASCEVPRKPSVWECAWDVGAATLGGAWSGVGAARGAVLGVMGSADCRGLASDLASEAFKYLLESPGDPSMWGNGYRYRQEDRLYDGFKR